MVQMAQLDEKRGYLRKPVALVAMIGGGFSLETKCLLKGLQNKYKFIYLLTEFGGEPGTDFPDGESFPVPYFSSVTNKSFYRSTKAFLKTLKTSFDVIRQRHVDAVIVVGCSHAVPMLLVGRFLRRKTFYIESITRVDRLSVTGKVVYYLRLSQIFIVQWPNLQQIYPYSRLGTVL